MNLDVILDDRHLRDCLGADKMNAKCRGLGGRKLFAHQMLLAVGGAAEIGDDVVGSGIRMPLAHRIQEVFARPALAIDHRVADVG